MNAAAVTSNVDAAMPAGHGLALTTQQRAVYELMMRFDRPDRPLAAMYLGAIHALLQKTNPERYAQAAHSLRELMEKLPACILGLPVKAVDLGNKVRELAGCWARVRNLPSAFGTQRLSADLQKYIDQSRQFFAWLDRDRDDARSRFKGLCDRVDPTGRQIRDEHKRLLSDRWIQRRSYFNRVSKHSRGFSPNDFQRHLDELERMLVEFARPPTFEEFAVIDQIIVEGEGRDC